MLVVAPLILAPEKKIIADLHREDTHSSVNRTFAHNSYPLPKIKSCQVVSITETKPLQDSVTYLVLERFMISRQKVAKGERDVLSVSTLK